MTRAIDLIVVGAGDRGVGHARRALAWAGGTVRVVGVAEPRDAHRERAREEFDVPPGGVRPDWRDLADRPRFADAVVIANPDAGHRDAAVAFAEAGYHVLLEKPMATTAADCRAIVEAVTRAGVILSVFHGLRYHRATAALKRMLDDGAIGEVLSVQHLEPVGFWHQAHSFVRGNWRNTAESSPMLLAKSCHDIDWLRYVIGKPALRVSSFGSLRYFRRENKPAAAGSATRCGDCAISAECLYSATEFYGRLKREGEFGWPLSVLGDPADLDVALRDGPYGRCVYECDNDVVDHQVVAVEYEGGLSASFTMVGTSEFGGRRTTLFGSHGELRSDQETITHVDFAGGRTVATPLAGGGVHGGDTALVHDFLEAVATGDPSRLLTGPAETLETHLTVFAAEKARREGRVVTLGEEDLDG